MTESFDFIERRKQQADELAAAQFLEYCKLVKKAAGGKLPPKEDARLTELITALGFTLELVQADASTFRRADQLRQQSKDLADLRAQRDLANGELKKSADERNAKMEELNRDFNFKKGNAIGAANALKPAEKAADDLAQLEQQHWQLFGVPDPSVEAKKVHLVQTVFERPAGPYEVIEFENLMVNPGCNYTAGRHVVPARGQSQEDLDTLMQTAKQIRMVGKEAKYLGTPEQQQRAIRKDIIITPHELVAGSVSPDSIVFLTPPGDSKADLQDRLDLVDRLEAAHDKKQSRENMRGWSERARVLERVAST